MYQGIGGARSSFCLAFQPQASKVLEDYIVVAVRFPENRQNNERLNTIIHLPKICIRKLYLQKIGVLLIKFIYKSQISLAIFYSIEIFYFKNII